MCWCDIKKWKTLDTFDEWVSEQFLNSTSAHTRLFSGHLGLLYFLAPLILAYSSQSNANTAQ